MWWMVGGVCLFEGMCAYELSGQGGGAPCSEVPVGGPAQSFTRPFLMTVLALSCRPAPFA